VRKGLCFHITWQVIVFLEAFGIANEYEAFKPAADHSLKLKKNHYFRYIDLFSVTAF
jgi:hypothetical protein